MHQNGINVVSCPETSTTVEIQKKLTKSLRSHHVSCLWSNPLANPAKEEEQVEQ